MKPVSPEQDFKGYFHNVDPTLLQPGVLTYPSVNCFIPSADKVVPRKPRKLLGENGEIQEGIIGNYEKFSNSAGIEFEIRAYGEVVQALYNGEWITLTVPGELKTPKHEFYFDDFLQISIDALETRMPRLIWVNGNDEVYSWTGGVAEITAINGNDIETTAPWVNLGFSGNIVSNGNIYTVTSNYDTDTLTLSSTVGLSVGDIVTAEIEVDGLPREFDVVSVSQNHAMYGSWQDRALYISNAYDRNAFLSNIQYNGVSGLNDVTFGGEYTGSTVKDVKITIDKLNPEENTEETAFNGRGDNLITFDGTGYTETGTNEYQVTIAADGGFTFTGTPAIVPDPLDILIGSTSGAIGLVMFLDAGGEDPQYFRLTEQDFQPGETITGTQGTYGTVFSVVPISWYALYKNGVFIPSGNPTTFQSFSNPFTDIPIADGITFQTENVILPAFGATWTYTRTFNPEAPDSVSVAVDGNTIGSNIPISDTPQPLVDGVTFEYINEVGHEVGDQWTLTLNPKIERAWANFFYSPSRKPFEGFILSLPSNFWTMKPQENKMYVNTKTGTWSTVETELSSDLLSEDIKMERLKSVSSSRALFPYMVGYMENYLVFIDENKKLLFIGRKELVELPQIGTLSRPVDKDFQRLSFEKGSIKFWDSKLWITSPTDTLMMCYDDLEEYWQPPQSIPECGKLSIVGNNLIAHSDLLNRSFELFTGEADDEPNYTVLVRTGYNTFGDRWQKKHAKASYIEGYIKGSPKLKLRLLKEYEGCGGILENEVNPVVCQLPTRAPIGAGSFGSHPNGSDQFQGLSHFRQMYNQYTGLNFYLLAFELECTSSNQTWELMNLGVDATIANQNNNEFKNQQILQN